ncbi:unnamed protein product [Acanthosepion pharaonis]|uniref:Uncharacterized protein n=1 Tax=Acanthosepion pharaonis TaxID=158019 RepID=A0A812EQ75_ACAPH|nr:unnamed protein product [Sepia pharaonis]
MLTCTCSRAHAHVHVFTCTCSRAHVPAQMHVAQRSALTQASQSQEERVTCLTGKAAYSHHQSLLRNVRNAAATAKSSAIETIDHRRASQKRDATATASARVAETPLCRSVRNARNTATTAKSRAVETPARRRAFNPGTLLQQRALGLLRHRYVGLFKMIGMLPPLPGLGQLKHLTGRRARQYRDAAATARSRESETELQRANCNARNAAATSAAGKSEGPPTRAHRLSRPATNMAAVRYSQTP